VNEYWRTGLVRGAMAAGHRLQIWRRVCQVSESRNISAMTPNSAAAAPNTIRPSNARKRPATSCLPRSAGLRSRESQQRADIVIVGGLQRCDIAPAHLAGGLQIGAAP